MTGNIAQAVQQYWGYEQFLPLQREAMESVAQGRDSLVVLPTGGGKSLCFQAPAVTMEGMAVVVSPLISLMKDQVDALTECGVPAARLDSTQDGYERNAVMTRIRQEELKLLYLAPERLMSEGFLDFLSCVKLSFVAIDEAHCVSMWGHDFRPEYRKLGTLKKSLGGVPVHGYTATATDQVRCDIVEQLHLNDPAVLVGSFDRPNLVYKVEPRGDRSKQINEIIDRHPGESGIIYCIRRRDVDEMTAQLRARGRLVAPYHAGMDDEDRKASQDAFIGEKVDIVVATVAFGMGIDKSNVRYVVHAAMPKSVEHYQQESGRAGRDGLEAECVLMYSGGDYGVWRSILNNSESAGLEIALQKLSDMYSYCTAASCRHTALLQYFGQGLDKDNCGACDVCLGEVDTVADALETAQKIISSVLRQGESFGADYTAKVLIGSHDQRIDENGHNQLSTYGLLNQYSKRIVRDWTEQLVGQGCLCKAGEYNVVKVTEKGWRVLRTEVTPCLLKPVEKANRRKDKSARAGKASKAAQDSWQGVDEGLFEVLRDWRRKTAQKKGLPAYVVFGDAALRDMARRRPSTPEAFLEVNGVGEKKRTQYGKDIIPLIKQYCEATLLDMDVPI